MSNRIRGLILPIPLLLAAQGAQALGLGDLKVESALEQPLKGQIKLILNAGESLDQLNVRLASAADYDRVGLDATLVPPSISLALKKGPDGPYVELTSSLPINEPIVSLLIEADWPKGRLLREYTLLLDPPSYAPVATVAPAALSEPEKFDATVEEEFPAEVAEEPQAPSMAAADVEAEASTNAEEASFADDSLTREFPVQPTGTVTDTIEITAGRTLWAIASEYKPDGVSVHQMMLAILRANPQAFIDGNMNRLIKGSVLRIPDREEAQTVPHAEALAEVSAQSQQWVAYQEKVRDVMPAAYQTESPAYARENVTRGSRSDYELDLVPPATRDDRENALGDVSGSGAQTDASAFELARIREENAALEQEKQELASRVAELESIVNDQQSVLQMKDADLAKLQQQLASLNERQQVLETEMEQATADGEVPNEVLDDGLSHDAAATAEPVGDAGQAADALEVADTGAPEETQDDVWDQESELDETGQGIENTADTESPVIQDSLEEPVLAAEPNAQSDSVASSSAATAQQRSWWQKVWQWIIGNPLYTGGMALLLLLLGMAPRLLRKETQEEDGSFLDSIGRRSGDAEKTPASNEETTSEAELGDIDIDELLERIKQEPENVDLLYDAALYYYGEDDQKNFESMAEELYGRLSDPSHPKWQEIVELGQKIAPQNALFGVALLTEDQESQPSVSETELEGEEKTEVEDEDELQMPGDEDREASEDFSFDLDDYMQEGSGDTDAADRPEATETDTLDETDQAILSDLEADLSQESLEDSPEETGALPAEESVELDASSENTEDDLAANVAVEEELELSLDDLESELAAMNLDAKPDSKKDDVPEIDLADELDLDEDQDLMNFDFGEESALDAEQTDEKGGEELVREDTPESENEELLDIGFNLDDIVPEGDAVATKLDLARAYFEMGDIEGARAMIDEVLEEGDAEQKAQARALKNEMDDT